MSRVSSQVNVLEDQQELAAAAAHRAETLVEDELVELYQSKKAYIDKVGPRMCLYIRRNTVNRRTWDSLGRPAPASTRRGERCARASDGG